MTDHIVLSEFPSHGARRGFDEFAELYNASLSTLDPDDCTLRSKSATATTWTNRVVSLPAPRWNRTATC